ncbi:hypothetical protein KQI89_16935 [Clostridium sp. MSJ-4]|uniref:YcxB-like protein domain-containing protein n=1 Tax=Clostridium simiarum TaxID=2841506 RepID=A0ABS6F4M1_9CLOT|nr:hypothetical protein [Clostridium simiarum]MBU5593428.1 hypothetical protein [Clostridium simiarum]
MKIYYKNALEDLVDYNVYTTENSSTFKKFIKLYTLIVWVFLGIVIIFVYKIRNLLSTELSILCILLVGLLWFLINPEMYKKRARKSLIKNERKKLKDFSPMDVTLTLNEEGVAKESRSSQYKVIWSSVENVKVMESYICIYIRYLGRLGYLIVPIKTFKDPSEKDTFLQIFKQYKINIIYI